MTQKLTTSLYRDPDTGVIINRNVQDLMRYETLRTQAIGHSEIERRVDQLTAAVDEMRQILKDFMESPVCHTRKQM